MNCQLALVCLFQYDGVEANRFIVVYVESCPFAFSYLIKLEYCGLVNFVLKPLFVLTGQFFVNLF